MGLEIEAELRVEVCLQETIGQGVDKCLRKINAALQPVP